MENMEQAMENMEHVMENTEHTMEHTEHAMENMEHAMENTENTCNTRSMYLNNLPTRVELVANLHAGVVARWQELGLLLQPVP